MLVNNFVKDKVSEVLWRNDVVKIGDFVLSSGKRSHVYIDLRKLLAYPKDYSWVVITLSSFAKILMEKEGAECIMGIATGGLVWSVPVAHLLSVPFSYHRGKKKKYGLSKMIEGCDVAGRQFLIIDDVTTTGESIVEASRDVRKLGGEVRSALVIVDRCQGAKETLEKEGLTLYSLTDLLTVLRKGVELGMLSKDNYEELLKEVSCSI